LSELVKRFNDHFNVSVTITSIRAATRNHSIKSGRTGYFNKGGQPWNTGTKGMTGANVTSFKPGRVSLNEKPIGTERIDTKDGYIWVKIKEKNPYTKCETRYKLKHHVVWESVNGPIPEGKVVKFIDGNKMNCTIENLILINRRALTFLNHEKLHRTPDEYKLTHILTAQIRASIYKPVQK
jgi:hypothetical protein